MCGIAGFVGAKNYYPSKSNIKSCIKLMKLRGPDFQDIKKFNTNNLEYLFCASRLSIIDIDNRSNQPLQDDDGILIFNGEIYNYLELKKKMQKKKINFKTKSDTEVLLKFLNYFGLERINEIHGMWSFAYYSKIKKKFYLCRDRFGEKPIFYSLNKDKKEFYFGSNVNYIRKLNDKNFKINQEKIYDYLKYGFRSVFSGRGTFFKNINYVKPGELIEINSSFKVKFTNYLKLKTFKPETKDYLKGKKLVKQYVNNIIPKTLRSDVPVAFLLSGGVDSSIIAHVAKKNLKKIKFYSLKTDDNRYNEEKNINRTIKKLNLKHEYISLKKKFDKFRITDSIIKETGFPLINSTSLAINEICKKIKKDGYKVVVGGNGADEIFSGYYAHHLSYLISISKSKFFKKEYNNWTKVTRPHVRTDILKNLVLFKKNVKKNGFNFETNIYEKYFKIVKKKKSLDLIDDKNNDIFIKHLDNDLFYENFQAQTFVFDSLSMFNSLESRVPFASHQFYNLRNTISKKFLIKNGYAKYILRDAFKNELPKSVLFNTEKTGFYLPIRETINLKSKKFYKTIFHNKYLNRIIKLNLIKDIIKKDNLTQQDEKFIFLLYNTAKFMEFYQN